ncbi:hypothetical protein D3C87_1532010 [compost metagenome]
MILDVEATPAHRTAEVDSTKTMVDRVEERFDIIPDRLIGDTAYGTAPMLAWMVQDKGIEPHVPVWDRTCTRCSQAYRRHRAVPALTSRTKESRGAVCTPQTYFEDQPLAATRTYWCSRRIHACSSRSKPTSSRDAYLSGATGSGHRCAQLRRNPPINKATGHQYPVPIEKMAKAAKSSAL